MLVDSVRMTPREREVINLIAEGCSNKDIAKRLGIATHTVKSHVRNIMEKLALHPRLQIAAYAHARKSSWRKGRCPEGRRSVGPGHDVRPWL